MPRIDGPDDFIQGGDERAGLLGHLAEIFLALIGGGEKLAGEGAEQADFRQAIAEFIVQILRDPRAFLGNGAGLDLLFQLGGAQPHLPPQDLNPGHRDEQAHHQRGERREEL